MELASMGKGLMAACSLLLLSSCSAQQFNNFSPISEDEVVQHFSPGVSRLPSPVFSASMQAQTPRLFPGRVEQDRSPQGGARSQPLPVMDFFPESRTRTQFVDKPLDPNMQLRDPVMTDFLRLQPAPSPNPTSRPRLHIPRPGDNGHPRPAVLNQRGSRRPVTLETRRPVTLEARRPVTLEARRPVTLETRRPVTLDQAFGSIGRDREEGRRPVVKSLPPPVPLPPRRGFEQPRALSQNGGGRQNQFPFQNTQDVAITNPLLQQLFSKTAIPRDRSQSSRAEPAMVQQSRTQPFRTQPTRTQQARDPFQTQFQQDQFQQNQQFNERRIQQFGGQAQPFGGRSFALQDKTPTSSQTGNFANFANFGNREKTQLFNQNKQPNSEVEQDRFAVPSQISASTPGQPGSGLSLFEQIKNRVVQGNRGSQGEPEEQDSFSTEERKRAEQEGKRRVFEALLAEKKAKEEELERIKLEQEDKVRRAEELEVRRIQADKKRARLLEEAERQAEAAERKRLREEQAVKKQEEREERKRLERIREQRREEEETLRKIEAEQEERRRLADKEAAERRQIADKEVARIQAGRSEQQRAVAAAARAVGQKRREGSEKSSPAVWAAVKALSEFVDGSESRPGAVPRNILMAIMQLTDFLEKDRAHTGEELSSASQVSDFMGASRPALPDPREEISLVEINRITTRVPFPNRGTPAFPNRRTTAFPARRTTPRTTPPGRANNPRTPSPIRSRVLPTQDSTAVNGFNVGQRTPASPPRSQADDLDCSLLDCNLLRQFDRIPATPRPQPSRQEPRRTTGRPFPDGRNTFLPAPTPSAPFLPTPPTNPPVRFPTQGRTPSPRSNPTSAVRSNGQFSFGELPVRKRRGWKQRI